MYSEALTLIMTSKYCCNINNGAVGTIQKLMRNIVHAPKMLQFRLYLTDGQNRGFNHLPCKGTTIVLKLPFFFSNILFDPIIRKHLNSEVE